MLFEADGLGMLPRIGQPELATVPGMAARAPHLTVQTSEAPSPSGIPDTSISGPVTLQEPAAWNYDFNPVSGSSRATYNGEVSFSGTTPGVLSFNSRTGAVALILADVTGVGGAPLASPTFTGTVTIPAGAAIAGYAPLLSPTFTGNPTAPTQPLGDADTSIATTAFVRTGVTDGSNAPAGQIGEYITNPGGPVAMTTGTPANVGSITLTAGDWDVWGVCNWATSAGATALLLGISTVANSLAGGSSGPSISGGTTVLATETTFTPVTRVSISAAQTIYLVGQANFSTGGTTANSNTMARRVR